MTKNYKKYLYRKDEILTYLEDISFEFHEYTRTIKFSYNTNANILDMICRYIFELRIILYIIEFIESIFIVGDFNI